MVMDTDKPGEKRRHARHAVDRAVNAVSGGRKHKGRLRDISASGAAIQTDGELDADAHVEIEIEDMEDLSGRVARSFDDGFAVEFELEDDDEDYLLDEIAALDDAIRREEM
jgi:hypothetical protein